MKHMRIAAVIGTIMALTLAVAVFVVPEASALAHGHTIAAFDLGQIALATPAMIASLRSKRTGLVGEMQAMIEAAEAEDRDLSEDETAAFDAKKAEKEAIDKRLERAESLAASAADLNLTVPAASRQGRIERAPAPEARREFESFGEFLSAVRFNPNDQRLNFVQNAGADGENFSAEMRMDNDTSGGFMVPPQLRSTILQVQPEASLVRPRAQVIEAGSPPDAPVTIPALDQDGTAPQNMYGGVEVKWIGEGEEKPETDANLKAIELTPHEVAGLVTVTDKLLRNWQAAGSFIEGLLRGAVTAAEDDTFIRGSGSQKPLGAINAGATYYVNRALANKISYLDLLGMVSHLMMRGGSPVWSMPQSALTQIATMQDPSGQYIWKPNAVDGFAGTLLGYPLRWHNRMPALGSKGDVILADWSHYLIKDGSGPFVAASEHVKFTSNKTVIKIFWNVDGQPWLKAPIKEENGYEVSPFVGLDVPA
ncbi:phage major capsid protein [Jiella pelagia]|uniref:Phage major capsid protein n=2 Tax=Jiella pelagia TaxID=2986949 RepID=A0ABY7BWB8_9HYPH|nr:phage major capsid protein [Jiella pelagia]